MFTVHIQVRSERGMYARSGTKPVKRTSAKSVDLCTKHARLHNKTILWYVLGVGEGWMEPQFKAADMVVGFQVDNKPNSGFLHFKLDKF